MKKALVLALMACFSFGTHAAGFDCNKASTVIEKTICKYPELDELDTQLNRLYNSNISDELKKSQRAWIKDVRNTQTSVKGLISAYKARIAEIESTEEVLPVDDFEPSKPVANAAMPEEETQKTKEDSYDSPAHGKAVPGSIHDMPIEFQREWLEDLIARFDQKYINADGDILVPTFPAEYGSPYYACASAASSAWVDELHTIAIRTNLQREFLDARRFIESGAVNVYIQNLKSGYHTKDAICPGVR